MSYRAEVYYSCSEHHFGQPCDGDHGYIVGRWADPDRAKKEAQAQAEQEQSREPGREWGWRVIRE